MGTAGVMASRLWQSPAVVIEPMQRRSVDREENGIAHLEADLTSGSNVDGFGQAGLLDV
jgi:hypothetical protein